MAAPYETETRKKFGQIRPHENLRMFDTLMGNDAMRVIVQVAFEAGRSWQDAHPSARLDVPDYDAPAR